MKQVGPFTRPRQPVHTEPCACGGLIGVLDADARDGRVVRAAIERHQASPVHAEWIANGGLERWQQEHGTAEQVPVVRE